MRLSPAILLSTLTLLPLTALPHTAHASAPYETIVNNGPSSNRVDIVFVGDGYRQTDIDSGLYRQHIQSFTSHMFGASLDAYFFSRYQKFFNVHQVNVVSTDNGADRGDYGTTRNTALDSTYFYDGVTERLLYLSNTKANAAASAGLAGSGITPDMRIATVNDTKYGGAGGTWATYAGGNNNAPEVALHEVAHSFAGLADEYFYNTPPYNSPFTGAEPVEPNATKSPSTRKWDRWLGYNDPNTNVGPIGYYEGSKYYQLGLFRPSQASKMQFLNRAFDAVSREAFIRSIYQSVRPLDSFTPNLSTLLYPLSLVATPVDDAVIGVNWFINNALVSTGSTLDFTTLSLPLGTYTIRAEAADKILENAFTGGSLDWYRLPDTSRLRQSVTWTVFIPEPGGTLLPLALLTTTLTLRRR